MSRCAPSGGGRSVNDGTTDTGPPPPRFPDTGGAVPTLRWGLPHRPVVAALFRRPLPNATIKDVTKDAGPSRNGSRGTAAGSSAPTGDPPTLDSPSTVRPCEDARRAEYERWLHQVL